MGKRGEIISAGDYKGPSPGILRPVAYIRLDNGTDTFALPQAVERSRQRGVKGPGGQPLQASHLMDGSNVEVDLRKGQVDRFISVTLTEIAKCTLKKRESERERQRKIAAIAEAKAAAYQYGETNPYTFLPFLTYRPEEGYLARPAHRTQPPDGRVSGRIRLRLTPVSPLATYGGQNWEASTHRAVAGGPGTNAGEGFQFRPLNVPGADEHRVTSLLRDAEGSPTLAGSAIKGVLRSWYEFVTSSHREIDPSGVAWRDTVLNNDARTIGILRLYRHGQPLPSLAASDDRELPDGVTATIVEIRPIIPDKGDARNPLQIGQNRIRALWQDWKPRVEGNRLRHGDRIERRNPIDGGPNHGWVQIGVGVGNNPSVGVRIVPDHAGDGLDGLPTDPPDVITVSDEGLSLWWEAHRRGGPNSHAQATVSLNGQGAVTCVPPDATVLRDGTPVFFERTGQNISYLSNVHNGRWAIDRIPSNRNPVAEWRSDDDHLDAARRVFGRITERDEEGSNWAGRIRISRVRYTGEAATEHFTIRPLQGPKVQAAGFYLQGGKTDDPVSWRPGSRGQVAGTKVYWHQAPIPDVDGNVADIGERVRLTALAVGTDAQPAKMKSNATIEALTGGAFDVELWFEDLDEDELGALMLSTSLHFSSSKDHHGYKLGMAKPLGFGSMRNEILEVAVTDGQSPTSLELRALDETDVKDRLTAARTHWFGTDEVGLKVADAIASTATLGATAFGYPPPGRKRRISSGEFKAEPKAKDSIS